MQVFANRELPDLRPRAHVEGGEAPPSARHLVLESNEEEIEVGRQRGRGPYPVGTGESPVLTAVLGVETVDVAIVAAEVDPAGVNGGRGPDVPPAGFLHPKAPGHGPRVLLQRPEHPAVTAEEDPPIVEGRRRFRHDVEVVRLRRAKAPHLPKLGAGHSGRRRLQLEAELDQPEQRGEADLVLLQPSPAFLGLVVDHDEEITKPMAGLAEEHSDLFHPRAAVDQVVHDDDGIVRQHALNRLAQAVGLTLLADDERVHRCSPLLAHHRDGDHERDRAGFQPAHLKGQLAGEALPEEVGDQPERCPIEQRHAEIDQPALAMPLGRNNRVIFAEKDRSLLDRLAQLLQPVVPHYPTFTPFTSSTVGPPAFTGSRTILKTQAGKTFSRRSFSTASNPPCGATRSTTHKRSPDRQSAG